MPSAFEGVSIPWEVSMKMRFNSQDLERLAQRFKILGEPTRLQILSEICDQELSVHEICQQTGLHQANASKHLRLMKDAGVVACRKEGVRRYYRIAAPEIQNLCLHVHEALRQTETAATGQSQMESAA